ncbi:MAG: RHS repeat-associated core domain-containing protein [Porticoccaceae bacterium]
MNPERYDEDSGLYCYKARYYHAGLGRFLSVDPIGYDDQMNLYAYVANAPMLYRDPSGKLTFVTDYSAEETIGKGIGGSFGSFIDFTDGDVGLVASKVKTAGFLADVGTSFHVLKGGDENLSGPSTTERFCLFTTCGLLHRNSSGGFSGVGLGGFAGGETIMGGAFSHHEQETSIPFIINSIEVLTSISENIKKK